MNSATLKQLHFVEIEILDEIVRICKLYNLRYYLIGGTLLGAVRHKGFIPWDDDLDIAMPREDYNKFLQISSSELKSMFYLHTSETDSDYWLPFVKVRKRNTVFDEAILDDTVTKMNGIWVDIFPLDKSTTLDSLAKRTRTILVKDHLQHFIVCKKHNIWPNPVFSKIIYFIFKSISIKTLRKIQDIIMSWEDDKVSCKYYINLGSKYNPVKQTILISDYEPTTELEFEGKKYAVPGNYNNVLERVYGKKYMELPPEEERFTHSPLRLSFDTSKPDAAL